jgi:DNA-binding CsgD family transcriptional regulator
MNEHASAAGRAGEGQAPNAEAAVRLHEGQRTCLKLVASGMSTKEIARETGLSPSSVDTYLKQAMAALGVNNRREAARRYAQIDASQKSGSPPPALFNAPDAASEGLQTGAETPRHWQRFPPVGGADNDLSWPDKTLLILQIAAVGAGVMLALTLAIAGLLQILK